MMPQGWMTKPMMTNSPVRNQICQDGLEMKLTLPPGFKTRTGGVNIVEIVERIIVLCTLSHERQIWSCILDCDFT